VRVKKPPEFSGGLVFPGRFVPDLFCSPSSGVQVEQLAAHLLAGRAEELDLLERLSADERLQGLLAEWVLKH
jgi:hypothetical protein